MADIRKFNSMLNSKASGLDILRLGELRLYPNSKALAPLKQDLAEFASKKDFFSFCDSLQKELLSKTISKENFIEKGTTGKVFRIPGTDCAVKVPLDCAQIPNLPVTNNISPQEKINLIVGKIGEDINIITFIDGKNVKQLTHRGISIPKTVLSMPHETYARYIEKIIDASKVNMYHNFGSANALINEKYRFIIPIDFYPSLTRKANPIEDLYFHFGNYMKTQKEQDKFLAKTSLAFVDLIRTNKITTNALSKTDVSLSKIVDCFMPENKMFFYETESRLKKITALKKMETISPDITKRLEEEIIKFNDFIIGALTDF